MAAHYTLDLEHFPADPALVECIPHSLAIYYEVLPIAREGNQITVVTAHPENSTALAVLGRMLQAEIVPVQCPPEVVRAALRRLQPKSDLPEPRFLAWSGVPEATEAATKLAAYFGEAHSTPVTDLTATGLPFDAVLDLARANDTRLLALALPDAHLRAAALRQAPGPLLLVRGSHTQIRRILIVLRGYASDEEMLNWALPFARLQAELTLLPLTTGLPDALPTLLRAEGAKYDHLATCLARLESVGVRGKVRFRQGEATAQVADELAYDAYDLMFVAAEGYGEFVASVLKTIERRNVHVGRPIFVLKPVNTLVVQ